MKIIIKLLAVITLLSGPAHGHTVTLSEVASEKLVRVLAANDIYSFGMDEGYNVTLDEMICYYEDHSAVLGRIPRGCNFSYEGKDSFSISIATTLDSMPVKMNLIKFDAMEYSPAAVISKITCLSKPITGPMASFECKIEFPEEDKALHVYQYGW